MPEATELFLVAIEQIGVADSIATRQPHLRQITCTEHVGGLFGEVDGILEHLQFRTICHGY